MPQKKKKSMGQVGKPANEDADERSAQEKVLTNYTLGKTPPFKKKIANARTASGVERKIQCDTSAKDTVRGGEKSKVG